MNKSAFKFQLRILLLSALFTSCSAHSTPNELTTGNAQLAFQPVVNPGTLHSTKEAAMASLGGKVPSNLEILKYSERRTSGDTAQGWYVVEKTPIITRGDLQYARAVPVIYGGRYNVALKLKPRAAENFREWTKANSGDYLAIVLDGVVLSAPVIKGEIPNGDVIIDGNFTKEEAENLSVKLRRS
jgi:preprotein translocase subunit SecD